MAIRFIDTNFYKSPFVRGLEGSMKSLYSFIICDCSGAGIWAADFEVASLYTGFKLDSTKFSKFFVETKKAIDLGGGRFFFPDFIDHQYPKGLSSQNPAHKNVIIELSKYQLIEEDDKGAWKVLQRPFEGSQVIVKDMVMVTDEGKEKVKGSRTFKKPSLNEVSDYMTKLGHPEQADRFFDHYTSNGWRVSKNPMADWNAACRNWIKNKNSFTNGTTKERPKPIPVKNAVQDEHGNWTDLSGEDLLKIMSDRQRKARESGGFGDDNPKLLQP